MENGLEKQNIQDRYHGRNDPVAKRMLGQAAESSGLKAPADQSIVRRNSPFCYPHSRLILHGADHPPLPLPSRVRRARRPYGARLRVPLPPAADDQIAVHRRRLTYVVSDAPIRNAPLNFISTADCAFVAFATRAVAERVAESIAVQGGLEVSGKKAKIVWGRARPAKGGAPKEKAAVAA